MSHQVQMLKFIRVYFCLTDLHEPIQENGPHLGLKMRMLVHHVDIPGVALVLFQHVVPHNVLTGPAEREIKEGRKYI